MEIDPDAEARVFYVGLTRARETLNLVMPQTQYGYPL
jgi:superfamily I DNA/RNA helicase